MAGRVLGDAGCVSNCIHILACKVTVEFGVRSSTQYDDAIGARAVSQRVFETRAHGKNRKEPRDHACDANQDDARCAEPIRQTCHAHGAQFEPLPKHQRFSASASTIFKRFARRAGGSPTMTAMAAASANPGMSMPPEISTPCNASLM